MKLYEMSYADYLELKKLHNKAIDNAEDSFMFKGNELLVHYTKFLIEHLNYKFKG